MLNLYGAPKLCDLDVAGVSEGGEVTGLDISHTNTPSKGYTQKYAAPEVCMKLEFNSLESDIWSLV